MGVVGELSAGDLVGGEPAAHDAVKAAEGNRGPHEEGAGGTGPRVDREKRRENLMRKSFTNLCVGL